MEDYVSRHGFGLLAALINAMLLALSIEQMPDHQANAFAYEVYNSKVNEGMFRLVYGSSYPGTHYSQEQAEVIWRMSQTLCSIVKCLPMQQAVILNEEVCA